MTPPKNKKIFSSNLKHQAELPKYAILHVITYTELPTETETVKNIAKIPNYNIFNTFYFRDFIKRTTKITHIYIYSLKKKEREKKIYF